jgi:5-hydroxyisourate hydrolase-like protein (transthyretin family)
LKKLTRRQRQKLRKSERKSAGRANNPKKEMNAQLKGDFCFRFHHQLIEAQEEAKTEKWEKTEVAIICKVADVIDLICRGAEIEWFEFMCIGILSGV